MASGLEAEFSEFVAAVGPRLRRALAGCRGVDGADEAVAEAFAFAWEHWGRVRHMENPVGYLFRVGQSRTKPVRRWALPAPETIGVHDVEPNLIRSLMALPETQRTAVWLVHACEWRYSEVAEAMGTTASTVGNHVARALRRLRDDLEVESRA